ncbi:MAG: GDSL-type esterase/lipase family protein [Actinomycetota bacterium]|nr:GDSL-type esterase/lipase family protein [Actinomycetota bacterium]
MPLALLLALALFLIAGCGGGSDPEAPAVRTSSAPASEQGGDLAVAALGDSITAGSPLYDPDPEMRAALGFGDDQRSQFEYWATRADPSLAFENCGVFGERTDEIALRLEACAEGADVLIVQGGINDIAQALAGGPEAALDAAGEAAANIDGMITQGKELGLDVVVVNVLPWNNGHPIADDPIDQLNSSIAAIAEREGVPLIDFYGALEDPDTSGVMAPELTDDGDHPSIEGYKLLGALVADEIS